jgi:hypothetical protein
MEFYKLRAWDDWALRVTGEKDVFKTLPDKPRAVRIQVNTTGPVNVMAADNADMMEPRLLASVNGLAEIEFTTTKDVFVEYRSERGAVAYVTGTARDHVVEAVGEEVFTTIEPRTNENSQFRMMRALMMQNQRRVQEMLAEERAALAAEREASRKALEPPVVEPEPEPEPEPTPKKKPAKQADSGDEAE